MSEGAKTLRILDLEDDPLDTELIQANLAEGGIPCEITRVETREELVAALESGDFDLILSDYALPSFDGLSALKTAREIRSEVPFVLVSGAIGEERAIEALKSGATDYVLKQRLERLVPAVRRAVREAEERTERRRAEEALGRSEERYRTLVEQIPAVTYIQKPVESDNPKAVTYISPQYETMLGYPADSEVIDEEHWLRTLHPDDRERVLAEEVRTDETGEPFKVEYRVVARDGRVVWVRDEATLVRDEEGQPLYWLGVQYDITEQKRVEEALREVREAERHRLARDLHDGVLQDLSYTTAAIGIIMLEAEGTGLEEELQRAVDAVRRAAQGLRDAVNDLRLGEDQDQPFPELVESLVTKNRAMARASRIELEVEEGFPATPMGDAGTEVLRVIQEALTNARRHSGAQNVLLTLRVDDDELMAVISDDGRGFNPRVGEDGIGLWSMQERAAALDGTLDIESEPGEGTRVRFRAPMSSLLRETPEVDTKRGNGGDGWE
jgi:two-component system sensor histidine kinase UhpB